MKTSRLLTALLAAALVPAAAGAAPAGAAARADVLLREGREDLQARDFDAAIRRFSQASAIRPDSKALFLLGWAHHQKAFQSRLPQRADKAEAMESLKAYSMALSLDPRLKALPQPRLLYDTMSLSYEALGAYAQALDARREALRASPEDPLVALHASRLRFRMGDLGRSAADLALSLRKARCLGQERLVAMRVRTDPLFSPILASQANRSLLRQALPAEPAGPAMALSAKERAQLRDAPRDPGASPRTEPAAQPSPALAQALSDAEGHYRLSHYRDVINAYDEALAIDNRSPSLSQAQTAAIYERLGASYARLGLFDQAVRSLRRSIEQRPAASAYYQLALAYALAGRSSEALDCLRQCLQAAVPGGERRRFLLMARTDEELEPVRALPGFASLASP